MRRVTGVLALLALAGCSSAATTPAAPAPVPAATSAAPVTIAPPPASPSPSPESIARPPDVAASPRRAVGSRPALPDALQLQFQALIDGCATQGWTLCHALGEHYLDRTGTTYDLDLTALLAANPDLAAQLTTAMRSAMARGGATFDTGWIGHDFTGATDWHYALGHVAVRVRGEGTGGHVRARTFLDDTYDFGAGTAFGSFARLVDEGRAAEFRVHGATPSYEVTP